MPHATSPCEMLGVLVLRLEKALFCWSRSSARAKVSSLTIAGNGISIQSSRGRSWPTLLRPENPSLPRRGRTRWRGADRALPKHALPLYAGLRSIAHTTERSRSERPEEVETPRLLSLRAIAPMVM